MRAIFSSAAALLAGCSLERSLGYTEDVWKGEYFGNGTLTGPARYRDEDASTLYFDWGPGSPMPDLPANNFSARLTRTFSFPDGTYRFTARSDDGVRVWVDDVRVIDQWHVPFIAAVDHTLTAGNHTVKVEYREQSGTATLQLSWPVVSPTVCGNLATESSCNADSACQWFSCADFCMPRNTADPPACICARSPTVESCDAKSNLGCGWFECQKKCLVTGMSIYSVCGQGEP